MEKVFEIVITDTVGYYIKAESEYDAVELALEWYNERTPGVDIEIVEGEKLKEIEKEHLIYEMN